LANISEEHIAYIIRAKSKTQLGSACYLLHIGFLLGLIFGPEGEGDMLLEAVS
jgi:hypothetical protein